MADFDEHQYIIRKGGNMIQPDRIGRCHEGGRHFLHKNGDHSERRHLGRSSLDGQSG
jgi:hypothetical protein